MADCPCCKTDKMDKIQQMVRVLGCPCRWKILRIVGRDNKSTEEIYQGLEKHGEQFSKQGLYYHLSALQKAGLVDVAEYKEKGGGAPEKVWKVTKDKIVLNLLKGHESR